MNTLRKRMTAMMALLLTALLTVAPAYAETEGGSPHADVDYADMVYEGVDTTEADVLLQQLDAIAKKKDPTEEDRAQLEELYAKLRAEYEKAYTQQALGDVKHYIDVTDDELTEKTIRDALQEHDLKDRIYAGLRAAIESPAGNALDDTFTDAQKEFLLDYEPLTEKQKALIEKEESLEKEYDRLSEQEYTYTYLGKEWKLDDLYADDSLSSDKIMEIYTGIAKAENAATAPIYLELIKVRKEIAQEEGYDSYIDYAYDVIYDRDFTGEDIATLRETIISEIAPVYQQVYMRYYLQSTNANLENPVTGEELVQEIAPYMEKLAPELSESYNYMLDHHLYYIDKTDTMIGAGFTTDLAQYNAQFIYYKMDGSFYDYKTIVHEFGHYNAGYHAEHNALFDGLLVDVAEIQSQGLEMLMEDALKEMVPEKAGIVEDLLMINMLDSVMAGFEYDEFEQEAYSRDIQTVEELNKLAYEIDQKYTSYFYGDGDQTYDWSRVNHFFSSPLYYIGYATSALAALDIWSVSENNYEDAVEKYIAISKVPLNMPYQEATVNCGLRNMMKKEHIAQLSEQIDAWYHGESIPEYDADTPVEGEDASPSDEAAEEGTEPEASGQEEEAIEEETPESIDEFPSWALPEEDANTMPSEVASLMRRTTIFAGALGGVRIIALIIGLIAFLKKRG